MRAKNEVNFDCGKPRLFWTPRWPLASVASRQLHILFEIGARRRSADT